MYFLFTSCILAFSREGQGRDRVGEKQAGGDGDPHFPHSPPCLTTQGANTKREGRHGCPLPVEEAAQSYTQAHTQTSPPPHQGPAGLHREAEHCGSKGRGKQRSLLTDRWPAPPIPFLLYPQSLSSVPPLCLAILLWPRASSLLLRTERKRVQSREGGG